MRYTESTDFPHSSVLIDNVRRSRYVSDPLALRGKYFAVPTEFASIDDPWQIA